MPKAKSDDAARIARARLPRQLVLVADGGTARIFRIGTRNGARALKESGRLERPTAHAPTGTQVEYDSPVVEVERFAKRLARRIDVERRVDGIGDLIVIAEPRFLGVLRRQWSGPTQKIVSREVAKDLVRAADAQILKLTMP